MRTFYHYFSTFFHSSAIFLWWTGKEYTFPQFSSFFTHVCFLEQRGVKKLGRMIQRYREANICANLVSQKFHKKLWNVCNCHQNVVTFISFDRNEMQYLKSGTLSWIYVAFPNLYLICHSFVPNNTMRNSIQTSVYPDMFFLKCIETTIFYRLLPCPMRICCSKCFSWRDVHFRLQETFFPSTPVQVTFTIYHLAQPYSWSQSTCCKRKLYRH